MCVCVWGGGGGEWGAAVFQGLIMYYSIRLH